MAITLGSKPRRAVRTDLFWSVGRGDRYRLCASLVQLAGQVVIVTRTALDATRVAGELSRHGVPAASVDHRDFDAPYIRARVVTDETLVACARHGVRCVVQFDPAGGPRRYRRRVDLLTTPAAIVVTFVVPEREAEARVLLADLDLPDVLTGPELAVASRALTAAAEVVPARTPGGGRRSGAATGGSAGGGVGGVVGGVTGAVGGAVGQVRRAVRAARDRVGRPPTLAFGSASGDEASLQRDQRAS